MKTTHRAVVLAAMRLPIAMSMLDPGPSSCSTPSRITVAWPLTMNQVRALGVELVAQSLARRDDDPLHVVSNISSSAPCSCPRRTLYSGPYRQSFQSSHLLCS